MRVQIKPVTDTKIPGTDVPDINTQASESASQKRWMSRVAGTTAVLAALASISAMFASNHLNEAMIEQIRASDQWAFYQAKGIKLAVLEGKMEMLPAMGKTASDDDSKRAERYKGEQQDISNDAKKRQTSADDHRRRYKEFGRAATGFQIGIAVAAVALLVRRNSFWILSILLAVAGMVFFCKGLFPLP